ncbi:MAG: cyclic nucleotide-binding domain-containing protein [Bdellovibrionales bacterium]
MWRHVARSTVFRATDGLTAAAKFQNLPPHVLITELKLPKLDGLKLVDQALATKGAEFSAILILGPPPDQEQHLDQIVTGKVQYVSDAEIGADIKNAVEFTAGLMRALNYSAQQEKAEFHLRFLAKGDLLLREGDRGDFVYFVKKGQLRAYHARGGEEITLGMIGYGEFVGEMAYINGEPRSANVAATTDCELIEVPIGRFEKVLFKRPSWSKALMMSLSKRLKAANRTKSQIE